MNRCLHVLIFTGTCHVANINAHAAETWPARPVRLVLSFGAPGGSPDMIARLSSPKLSEMWGKQVVVDPRTGAGGVLGTDIGAKAPPDGYTMVVVSPAHAINPALRKLPYDSVKDFESVTKLAEVPNILSIYPQVGAKSAQELAALAKAKPGAYSFGSAGVGSSQHLAGALFGRMAGINILHVPYKGGGAVVLDLIAGRVHMTFGSATSLPHIRAGRLRALAVTTLKRSPVMADIPTMHESGYPGFEAAAWYGLLVPARTPAAIVNKLHKDFSSVLQLPEVRDPLLNDTVDPAPSASPKAFAAFLAAETAKWGVLVRETGAKAD
ncbi:MAG: tripartite tricarboxylate transporter substrate binding protein [Burkholderiales bacterium]